ncbi:MAG: AmmeMemoRadiSam system radical SAM enzyme [Myxococcota bacterium]
MVSPGVVPGGFWHREGEKLVCDLCPRRCRLNDGQRAFCFVRKAEGDRIVMTSYGRASGFCVDPIEKKPLNHFHPGSSVLSFGTAGCNLGCRFCQNWDISKAKEMDRMMDWAPADSVADAALKAGCKSVAFTYNDPVIFAEYAIDTAAACKERGVKTVAVSAGYITPEARGAFYRNIDATNIDLKGFTETFYKKRCFGHLEPVLDTLRWLVHETDVWVEVTTLLIPGENDSEDEVARQVAWFLENLGPEVPLHFTAFHPDFKMTDVAPTPPQTLERARRQARSAGIHHVYTGNVHDAQGQSTYCAHCGECVIERDWYRLGAYRLDDAGRCLACGTALAGRFEGPPGSWGPRRRRLFIA